MVNSLARGTQVRRRCNSATLFDLAGMAHLFYQRHQSRIRHPEVPAADLRLRIDELALDRITLLIA
jgi:hypothetical protein